MNNEPREKIAEIKKHVDDNICTDLNVTEIAEKFKINTQKLTELFYYFYGYTPKEYILNKKYDKFLEILSNESPKEIQKISIYGFKLGFKSASSFSNFIKKMSGRTCISLIKKVKNNLLRKF